MNHKIPDPVFNVGDRVQKCSGKPFKSKLTVNTVKGFDINPHTQRPSLTFLEDETQVEAFRCEIAK